MYKNRWNICEDQKGIWKIKKIGAKMMSKDNWSTHIHEKQEERQTLVKGKPNETPLTWLQPCWQEILLEVFSKGFQYIYHSHYDINGNTINNYTKQQIYY